MLQSQNLLQLGIYFEGSLQLTMEENAMSQGYRKFCAFPFFDQPSHVNTSFSSKISN